MNLYLGSCSLSQTSIYLAAFSESTLGGPGSLLRLNASPTQLLTFAPLRGNSTLPGAQVKAMESIPDSHFSPTPRSIHGLQEILLVVPSQRVQSQTPVVPFATPTLGGVTKTSHRKGPLTGSLFLPLTLVVCSQHSSQSDVYTV